MSVKQNNVINCPLLIAHSSISNSVSVLAYNVKLSEANNLQRYISSIDYTYLPSTSYTHTTDKMVFRVNFCREGVNVKKGGSSILNVLTYSTWYLYFPLYVIRCMDFKRTSFEYGASARMEGSFSCSVAIRSNAAFSRLR